MSRKPPDRPRLKISRRRFAQAATIAAASAVILPDHILAQAQASKPGAAPAAPPQQPSLTPAEAAEADARTSEILRKYGSRMTEAQKADVRRQVHEAQHSFTELRAFPLANSDAPATVLRIRPRDRK